MWSGGGAGGTIGVRVVATSVRQVVVVVVTMALMLLRSHGCWVENQSL